MIQNWIHLNTRLLSVLLAGMTASTAAMAGDMPTAVMDNTMLTVAMDITMSDMDNTMPTMDIKGDNLPKEIKRQAKEMKKEGWTVNEGDKPLEVQLADVWRYSTDSLHIVESGSQVSKSMHTAYNMAHTKALRALAARLNTMVEGETETVVVNSLGGGNGSDASDGKTASSVERRVRTSTEEALSNAFPVLVVSRQRPDGIVEVQVHLALPL